jgi:dihydropyrimidine dehydrogenase (NAD+) subunit PreA
MSILSSRVFNIEFDNPFLLSSSPLTANSELVIEGLRAGWGGFVMQTIGISPQQNPPRGESIIRSGRTKWGVVDRGSLSRLSLEAYAQEINKIQDVFPDCPVIVSIFGGDELDHWQEVVQQLEPHGVDAFEIYAGYQPSATNGGSFSELGQDREALASVVGRVRGVCELPIIVKLSPNVTDIVQVARASLAAGANGFTATSGLLGVGGIDPTTLMPIPSGDAGDLVGHYHGAGLRPVALRWTANLAKDLDVPIIGCGGVAEWEDAAEYLSVGATLVQVGSAAIWHGIHIIHDLKAGLDLYLEKKSFSSVTEIIGKALPNIVGFSELDIGIKLIVILDEALCIGCNVCVRACDDGGFQAIRMVDEIAVVDIQKCDGCGLCIYVCPPDIMHLVPKKLTDTI